jgi:hypothetical protein
MIVEWVECVLIIGNLFNDVIFATDDFKKTGLWDEDGANI